jgi:hypothetical protein
MRSSKWRDVTVLVGFSGSVAVAVTMPGEDRLPPGPRRVLTEAVHTLYEAAGMPGTHRISDAIEHCDDLPDMVSHEAVRSILLGEPSRWAEVECVVRVLATWAVAQLDPMAEAEKIHELWRAAQPPEAVEVGPKALAAAPKDDATRAAAPGSPPDGLRMPDRPAEAPDRLEETLRSFQRPGEQDGEAAMDHAVVAAGDHDRAAPDEAPRHDGMRARPEPRLCRDRVRPGPVARTADTGSTVRLDTCTGRRVEPGHDLPVETLISVMPHAAEDATTLTAMYQAIVGLCRDGRSVAEVSVLLRLPLEVARVLVADMVNEGLLRLHPSPFTEERPDARLLERVLGGLRQL